MSKLNGSTTLRSTALLLYYFFLPKGDDHDDCVGEVEQCRHELVNLQLRTEVEDAVRGNVHGGPTRHNERPGKRRPMNKIEA